MENEYFADNMIIYVGKKNSWKI